MTKEELLLLNQGLQKVLHLSGVKFAYAINRNLDILKPEMEALEKAAKPSEDYLKFDAERIELVEKYAEKDEKGKAKQVPMATNPQQTEYVIEEGKQKELDKEFGKLKEKHKEAIEAREKQVKEYNELLKTETTKLEFHKVNISDIPNQINGIQMNGIKDIIIDSVVSPIQA